MMTTKEEIRKLTIAEIFESTGLKRQGFRYLKSKGYYERMEGDFLFVIGFGSTKVNVLDDTNLMIVTASVSNKRFAEWRNKKFGVYPSGMIGGGKIKNLFIDGPPYFDFDLTHNNEIRQKVSGEIAFLLTRDVFDLFAMCTNEKRLIENINLPCFSVSQIIEYFAFKNMQGVIPTIIEKKSELFPELKGQIDYYLDYLKINRRPVDGFKETFTDQSKLIASQIAETLLKLNDNQ